MMNDNLQIADGIPAGISAGSFLNTKAELRFSYFDIRNSAFDIHPIRRALIEADLVECMVALPGQLFTNTGIEACIWFLTKNKAKRSRLETTTSRDRPVTLPSTRQLRTRKPKKSVHSGRASLMINFNSSRHPSGMQVTSIEI